MSDSEPEEELLELLRKSLGLSSSSAPPSYQTKVLGDAQYIYDNAIDVAIDSAQTKAAANLIWHLMQARSYSVKAWADHELHPKGQDDSTIDFIFTMDLLNFSFWSEDPSTPYIVEYQDKQWPGYWSLVAALQRALSEGERPLPWIVDLPRTHGPRHQHNFADILDE